MDDGGEATPLRRREELEADELGLEEHAGPVRRRFLRPASFRCWYGMRDGLSISLLRAPNSPRRTPIAVSMLALVQIERAVGRVVVQRDDHLRL